MLYSEIILRPWRRKLKLLKLQLEIKTMKTLNAAPVSRRWVSCLAGVSLLACLHLEAAVAVLELERSTDTKTWEKVALDPTRLTTTGGLLENAHDPKAFYRLRIHDDQNAGFITALPLGEAPPQAVAVAEQFIRELLLEDGESTGGDPEGGWLDVQLGPVCYPVYDPGFEDGKAPAYLEFKVVRPPRAGPGANDKFGMSPPDISDGDCASGHILVALTRLDFPVPSFSQSGPTPVERLLRTSRTSGPIKPLRFDDGLLLGEDGRGEIAASIGNEPFYLDPKILELSGKEFEGLDNEKITREDGAPEFPARAYASYREFKADFANNPLFVQLRRLRAELAAREWDAILGKEPTAIKVPVRDRVLVLETRAVLAATVEDPAIALVTLPTSGKGVFITGQQDGGTLLDVTYDNGTTETFLLLVGSGPKQGATLNVATSGWTSWSEWYAGGWSDQRRYSQFSNDPQMCPGGASGCGPAAWAMLYGWWDRKGSPRLIKNLSLADAPLYNDESVRDCNRYVFNQVGPFCVNGQAATMPWNMELGHRWAQHRGAGRDITWSWGVPYISPGSRNRAIGSIKAGRPAIVGLGFYWHYPLAYGYKQREYRALGITWDTQRYFKCNMGWGGSDPQWHNASSTWFGTHARFW